MFKIIKEVQAHCDIPCGIYETDTLKHAVSTTQRMVEKINELGEIDNPEKLNSFVRMVTIKEKHAQKAKDEIYILWSDYFKPEHLERFPDLHEVMWQAAKQASHVKQHISLEECQKLAARVAEVDRIFQESKS